MAPLTRAALLAALALPGCSSDPPVTEVPPLPGPKEWNRNVTPPTDAEAETARLSCAYTAGSLPAETQGESHPSGADIPVQHVIVLMNENRSFDHYFQKLPQGGQTDVEVAPDTFVNPDIDGTTMIAPSLDPTQCFVDTGHGWTAVHRQINGGAMDGFIVSNEANHELPVHGTPDMVRGTRAMTFQDETVIPFYFWLANQFSIADHYHCSVPGPTWPNRMFLYGATSSGLTKNTFPDPSPTLLVENLDLRKVSWNIYAASTPGMGMYLDKWFDFQEAHLRGTDQFFADLEAGTLPQVTFLDPELATDHWDSTDEHPPAMAQYGQAFGAKVVEALMKSKLWKSSVLFITYDEHGGQFDHVVPPAACPPDDLVDPDADPPVGFDQYGIRVPFFVVSPFAKEHFVSHRLYDHTSIVRFIESRFVMPALTNRDANAEAPWEMFDFEDPPFLTPPAFPGMPPIDQAQSAWCQSIYEP